MYLASGISNSVTAGGLEIRSDYRILMGIAFLYRYAIAPRDCDEECRITGCIKSFQSNTGIDSMVNSLPQHLQHNEGATSSLTQHGRKSNLIIVLRTNTSIRESFCEAKQQQSCHKNPATRCDSSGQPCPP